MMPHINYRIVIFLTSVILAVTACSPYSVRENQLDRLTTDLENGQIGSAFKVLNAISFTEDAEQSRQAERLIKDFPKYEDLIKRHIEDQIALIKKTPFPQTYQQIQQELENSGRFNLLPELKVQDYQNRARQVFTDQISNLSPRSLRLTVDTYDFGDEITEKAKKQLPITVKEILAEDPAALSDEPEAIIRMLENTPLYPDLAQDIINVLPSMNLDNSELRAIAAHLPEKIDLPPAITLEKVATSNPNSAGGVNVTIPFKSEAHRTVKYVIFEVTAYNAVGDRVASTVDSEYTKTLRSTGPYRSGSRNYNEYWENVWYNHSIECAKIEEVEIQFTDGSKESYPHEEVYEEMFERQQDDCSYSE